FLHSFATNWRKQREEEYDHRHYEDDIYSRTEKIIEALNIERPALLKFKITYRNAFFFELMKRGRVLVINPSSTEAMHVYESMQRHNINGLVLNNSLNLQIGKHVVTNAVCANKSIEAPEEFDFIVLNEIQFLKIFDKELFSNIIKKFGKKAFFTTVFTFDTNMPTFQFDGRSEFSVEDKRNQPKSLNNSTSTLVYLFSSHNSVEIFFNNLVKKMATRDTVFYSSQLAPFQRLIISNLVKKRKIRKLISSTNNDGLPSLFGKVEIRLFDFPYTISEILDAISGEGNVLLQLNYSAQDVVKKREMLRKLFPSQEELKKLVEELNIYLPMKMNEFELLTSNFNIPKGVIKSVYRDLGGINEYVVYPVDYQPEKITRLKEREIELNYFERYTLQLESLTMREIYRLLEERYIHDVDLII
ncbi:MAG: single-stranded-DNA-specific exonuclease RecJ, partial [Fervidobacterium sp.]